MEDDKGEHAFVVLGKSGVLNVTTAERLAVEMSCKLRDSRGGEGRSMNGPMLLGIARIAM